MYIYISISIYLYIYLYVAAKIFETRASTREFQVAFPDFASVYQSVIDIIEDYNDSVDRTCKAQQDRKMKEMMNDTYKEQEAAILKASGGGGYVRTLANSRAAANTNTNIDKNEETPSSPSVEALPPPPPAVDESPSTNTNSKRLMFMSEAEKKQRAELAAKKVSVCVYMYV